MHPIFQSTPPVRGATRVARVVRGAPRDFNPRPPCGGRRGNKQQLRHCRCISIHAPRAGGDVGRARMGVAAAISIHAPRAGGDKNVFPGPVWCKWVFQSTPPVRGATSGGKATLKFDGDFNPRPPCGGRPAETQRWHTVQIISIHAPRAGGDRLHPRRIPAGMDFNPRPPCGGRRAMRSTSWAANLISIHAPRAGGDQGQGLRQRHHGNFNPRPPCGGRLLKFESLFGFSNNSCMVIRFLAAPSSLL